VRTDPVPTISVIIVTYNDREKLAGCIASILEQEYPPEDYEVIVVDDGSTDGTRDSLSEIPGLRVIGKEHSGPYHSRIIGVGEARGEILALIDADCTAPPGWLKNIRIGLEESRATAVGGSIVHRGNFWARLTGLSDFGEFQGRSMREPGNIPTCNMGVRREVFHRIGFTPEFQEGGDAVFTYRLKKLGYPIIYDPRILVHHHPRANFRAYLERAQRYGRGFVQTRSRYPGMPHARFVRAGLPGIAAVTLGRIFLDWSRLLRYREEAGISASEVFPAMALLFFKRAVSLAAAMEVYLWEKGRAKG
jgi:glycosyltransferase involved in cell wall biosynthesis